MTDLVVVFVTGLTTGGLSCLAVQGGLLASSIARPVEEDVPATLVAKPAALPKGKTRRQEPAEATPNAPARPKHVARPLAPFPPGIPPRSAPPAPDGTAARTPVGSATVCAAPAIALNMATSSAFSFSGRVSRTSATPSLTVIWTRSDTSCSRGAGLRLGVAQGLRRSIMARACGKAVAS